jgi:hypothetical protein
MRSRIIMSANSISTFWRTRLGTAFKMLRYMCKRCLSRSIAENNSFTAARSPSCQSVTMKSIWVVSCAMRSSSTLNLPSLLSSVQVASGGTSLSSHALRNELEEILSHVLEVEGMQNLMQ